MSRDIRQAPRSGRALLAHVMGLATQTVSELGKPLNYPFSVA